MMTAAAHEFRLNVRADGKNYSLDFQQAFFFGYTLARTRRFREAAPIFEALTRADEGGSPATIMLAYCKAGLKDFAASSELLSALFPEDAKEKAEQLHTAFVFLSLQMWPDAVQELAPLAQERPDLPVVCLLVADVMLVQRRRNKALMCWKMAVARDPANGAVAATARRLFKSQVKQSVSA